MSDAKLAGGWLKEKAVIARSRVSGDEVERAVTKCTSHKLKPPNEKHLARLMNAEFSGEDADFVAASLERRAHSHDWVTVVKTLITAHALMKGCRCDVLLNALYRRQGMYRVSAMKLTPQARDDVAASQARFVAAYARCLEERSLGALSSGLRARLEQTEFVVAELAAMAVPAALHAATSLVAQLRACSGVAFDEAWVNAATIAGLRLVLHDSKLLYIALSRRCMWLIDAAPALPAQHRPAALDVFAGFAELTGRLERLYAGAAELAQQGLLPRESVPALRPLARGDTDRVIALLRGGGAAEPWDDDLPEAEPLPAELLVDVAAPPSGLRVPPPPVPRR